MKCTLLGTAPGAPVAGKSHAALYFEMKEHSILLDCGEGTAQKLLQKGLSGDELDAIIISHYHPDHVAGIFMVVQMLYLEKRIKPLDIYLPERVEDFRKAMELFYLFPEKFGFIMNLKGMGSTASDYSFIRALENDHLLGYQEFINNHNLNNKMKSYSFMITDGNKSVVYTSDIFNPDMILQADDKPEVIIIDALHPKAVDILKMIEENKKVILTHGLSAELSKALSDIPESKYTIAYDDYQFQI